MNSYFKAVELYLNDYIKKFGDKPHSGDDLKLFFVDSEYYKPEFEQYRSVFMFRTAMQKAGFKCVNRKCGSIGKWAKTNE